MDFCVDLNKTDLQRVLRHSRGFETFLLPYAQIECCAFEIDFLFSTNLVNAKNMYCLDISQCKLSTLCFQRYMSSLKIVNVSECLNLVDEDFQVISSCNNLEQLFLSLTNISCITITSVCSVLYLMVLDLSGIPITTDVCVWTL